MRVSSRWRRLSSQARPKPCPVKQPDKALDRFFEFAHVLIGNPPFPSPGHAPGIRTGAMTQIRRQSLTAYGAPLCETIVDARRPREPRCWCASRAAASAIPTSYPGRLFHARRRQEARHHAPAGRCRSRSATRSPASSSRRGADAAVTPGRQGRGLSLDRLRRLRRLPARRRKPLRCVAPSRHQCRRRLRHPCLVPHPRYLIDYAPLRASVAAMLMCSGLTAYAALKRLTERARRAAGAAGRHGRRRHDGSRARPHHVRARAPRRRHRSGQARGRARRRRCSGVSIPPTPARARR